MIEKSNILIPIAIGSWILVGFLYLRPQPTQIGLLNPVSGDSIPFSNGMPVPLPKETEKLEVPVVVTAPRFKPTLKQEVLDLVNSSSGVYGVYIGGLGGEPAVDINITKTFYAASLTKVPLLMALYQQLEEGKLTLETEAVYLSQDYESGDGSIQRGGFGDTYTVKELAQKLIKESDNAAKNMLVRVMGFNSVVKVLQEAGAVHTDFAVNTTTPLDMVRVFVYLYSSSSSQEMSALMTNTLFEDRLAAGLPERVQFAHKIGSWPKTGSYHDCGIVLERTPYLVCVLSEGTTLAKSRGTMQAIATLTYRSRF